MVRDRSEDLTADLMHWTRTMLSRPYESLNGMALCPFAHDAWARNRVLVLDCSGDMFAKMAVAKNSFWYLQALMRKDIIILCDLEYDRYSQDQLFSFTDQLLAEDNNGIWLIPFHPDATEFSPVDEYSVDDYDPLLGEDYAMCFVQPTSHLNRASRALEAAGYYAQWDGLDFNEVKLRRRYGDGDG